METSPAIPRRGKTLLIRGAGDLASGIAVRLFRAGFGIVMCETAHPTTVRRTVAFSEAVRNGACSVEGIHARLAPDITAARSCIGHDIIAVMVDPLAACKNTLRPDALIDAIIAKRNTGTMITDAPVVIGIGPGFTAGRDCHAAVETARGHNLGRVIYQGSTEDTSGIPGNIAGYTHERILRAPFPGTFRAEKSIGDIVAKGDIIGYVSPENGGDDTAICAGIDGILRGLLADGLAVPVNRKVGDIDPRGNTSYCHTVSDKALAIGGGVLEALLRFL